MKIKFILILVSSVAFSQISTTSALAPTITNAGQGDLYLSTDTSQLYIGLSNGTVTLIGNESFDRWKLTGNSDATTTSLLGTTNDVKMNIGSNNTSILEFGKRSTLGLVDASKADYTDGNQYLVHLKGGGISALQFEASAASFYKPMFFTTPEGNFRLKGCAAGTDFFEMGSAGTSNNGSFEFVIGDDGDEPIIFKKNHYTDGTVEMMRIQGQGSGATSSVRVGISTNGVAANSVLQVGGSLSLPIRSVTASTILADNDYTVVLKPGTYSGVAVTLPAANTCKGRIYSVKNISGGNRTISSYMTKAGSSSTTLATARIYSFQSDGVDWQVINEAY
jgi:hypothetical protein